MVPLHSNSDDLLASAKSGDATAVSLLVDKYRSQLKTMVARRMDRRLAARFDASDVVQETMATAHKRMPEFFNQQDVPFYVWLRSIAWNHLVDLHRRHVTAKRRSVVREEKIDWDLTNGSVNLLAGRLAVESKSPSRRMVQEELKLRVKSAMSRLPEIDREILMLRHLEELSVRYVASVLGMSESAIRSRHFRAVEKLRNWLDES